MQKIFKIGIFVSKSANKSFNDRFSIHKEIGV